jgi:tRNA(Ile)-lysidine synthase
MNSETFSDILQGLLPAEKPPYRLAVAVSGGGDSLALCLLVKGFVDACGGEMLALTVDHGLRAESRAEAEAVGAQLAARRIPHRILPWQGSKPETHVQEVARAARYGLLLQACKDARMTALCVAHNLEDQIETFWMRLAHGSGLDGLAAMAPRRLVRGVPVIRPLLSVPRAALRDYCRAAGLDWAEDPSNENERFLRVKLRRFEELLAEEGLTPQRLMQTVQKLQDARAALQVMAAAAFAQAVQLHPEGYAVMARADFEAQPQDIRRRVLSRAVSAVAPQNYPPGAALDDALADILSGGGFAGRTLGGCELSPLGQDVLLTREAAAVSPAPLRPGTVWDGRFEVAAGNAPDSAFDGLSLGLLGEAGLSALRKILAETPAAAERLEKYPAKLRKILPAVRSGENLLCVPHLSWVAAGAEPALKNLRLHYCSAQQAV